jgi:ABC-type uncharacterized transport system substrate-binding protein
VALGYREDVQFVMGVRFTQGDLAALPAAARELVQAGVDVLIADSDNAAKAAQMATTRIPIVFMYVADPMGLGLIGSFARPGGNITGVTNLELELGPKRLEVFQEIVPGLKRVLFPYAAHHTSAAAAAQVKSVIFLSRVMRHVSIATWACILACDRKGAGAPGGHGTSSSPGDHYRGSS